MIIGDDNKDLFLPEEFYQTEGLTDLEEKLLIQTAMLQLPLKIILNQYLKQQKNLQERIHTAEGAELIFLS